MFEYVKINQCC